MPLRGGSDDSYGDDEFSSDDGEKSRRLDEDNVLPTIDEEAENVDDEEEEEEEWFDAQPTPDQENDGHTIAENDPWEDEEEEDDFVSEQEEEIRPEMTRTEIEDEGRDGYTQATTATVEVEAYTKDDADDDTKESEGDSSSFTAQAVLDNPTIDDNDSSTYMDRMELADAYDEDVAVDTDPGAATEPVKQVYPESTTTATTTAAAANAPAVPTSIDAATRKTLIKDLKYRKKEVDAMKPEIAAIVADKRLSRPWEGMPANWYRNGKPSQKPPITVCSKYCQKLSCRLLLEPWR